MNFYSQLRILEQDILNHIKQLGHDNFVNEFSKIAFKYLSKLNFSNYSLENYFFETLLDSKTKSSEHHYDLNSTASVHFTIVRNPKFFIEVYSWLDHTETHDHNFCGAFKQLYGESWQYLYQFDKSQDVNADIELGNVGLVSSSMIKAGDCFEIKLGDKFIHQVLHLSKPTITICVRTADLHSENYYRYLFPHLRIKNNTLNKNENLLYKAAKQAYLTNQKFSEFISLALHKFRPASLIETYLMSFEKNDEFHEEYRRLVTEKLNAISPSLVPAIDSYRISVIKTIALHEAK